VRGWGVYGGKIRKTGKKGAAGTGNDFAQACTSLLNYNPAAALRRQYYPGWEFPNKVILAADKALHLAAGEDLPRGRKITSGQPISESIENSARSARFWQTWRRAFLDRRPTYLDTHPIKVGGTDRRMAET